MDDWYVQQNQLGMRFFTLIGKTKTADAEKICSASGGQEKKRWTSFRLFRAKKGAKNAVDDKKAEMMERLELEDRILKWLSESSREEIAHQLDLIDASSIIDVASAPEDVEASVSASLKMSDLNCEAFSFKEMTEGREECTPSTAEAAQQLHNLVLRPDRPNCLVTPRRDILRPCNFQQGLLRLAGLEDILDLPSGLRTNYGLTLADSFRSLASPMCGGAR